MHSNKMRTFSSDALIGRISGNGTQKSDLHTLYLYYGIRTSTSSSNWIAHYQFSKDTGWRSSKLEWCALRIWSISIPT